MKEIHPQLANLDELEKLAKQELGIEEKEEVIDAENNEEIEEETKEIATEEEVVEEGDGEETKTLTVDDLDLSEEKKKEILEGQDKREEKDKPSDKITKYNEKARKKREERESYRIMSLAEKAAYLDEKYSKKEIIRRYIHNDNVLPSKDRAITNLKKEADQMRGIALDLSKENEELVKRLGELESSKKEIEESDFIKKWAGEAGADEDFLKDMQEEIRRKVEDGIKSGLDKKIKPLQNKIDTAIVSSKETDFVSELNGAVPDISNLIQTAEYGEIYNLRVNQLPKDLSGYLMGNFKAPATSSVGEVITWLESQKSNKSIEPLSYIFGYVRDVVNMDSGKGLDKLSNQVQAKTSKGSSRPKQVVEKSYSESDITQLKKDLIAGRIDTNTFNKKLAEIEKSIINDRFAKK